MADPRGRGFKRGRGRWHSSPPGQTQAKRLNHPETWGWQFIGLNDDGVPTYALAGDKALVYYSDGTHQEKGWWVMLTETEEVFCYQGHIAGVTADVERKLGLTAPAEPA